MKKIYITLSLWSFFNCMIFFLSVPNLFASELFVKEKLSQRSLQLSLQTTYTKLVVEDVYFENYALRSLLHVFFSDSWALEGGYFRMTDPKQGATLFSGFEFGLRWYPFQNAAERQWHWPLHRLSARQSFKMYVSSSYRSRTLHGEIDVAYGGYGFGAGVQMAIIEVAGYSVELNAEYGYESLVAFNRSDLQVNHGAFGFATNL